MKNKIKEIRLALGLSQAKFGELIGLSQKAITAYEVGRYPVNKQTLLILQFMLNVNPDYLEDKSDVMFK